MFIFTVDVSETGSSSWREHKRCAEFCAALLSNTIYTITLAFGVKMSKNVSTEQILLVFIELKGTVHLKMNIQSSSPPPGRLNLFGFRTDKQ